MQVGRGGGHRYRYGEMGVLVLAFLMWGCRTVANPVPRPCDRLEDRPGLREEVSRLRDLPGDPTRRLRWYALDADVSCAGNRVLGAPAISIQREEPSFWARIWGWF